MWLPKNAVKLVPGSADALVFTVADNRAVAHSIKIGARTEKNIEIKSGVAPGMQIVAENVDKVDNGSKVKVIRTIAADEQ